MWRKTPVTFALNLAVAGYGWLPSQSALSQDAQIRISSAVVNVPVAVYDKKTGVVYQNLKKENFQIFEDGVRQEVTNFAAPESELNLALLLENSRRLREVDRGDHQRTQFDRMKGAPKMRPPASPCGLIFPTTRYRTASRKR
jgi:hypothetical protein